MTNEERIKLGLIAAQAACGNYVSAAVQSIKNWRLLLGVLSGVIVTVIVLASIIVSLPGIIMQSMLQEDKEDQYKELSLFAKNEIVEADEEKKSFLQSLIDSLKGNEDSGENVVADVNLEIDYQDILILYSAKYGEYMSQDKLNKSQIRSLARAFVKQEGLIVTIKPFEEVVTEIGLTEEQQTIALSMHNYYMGDYALGSNEDGASEDGSFEHIGNGQLSKPIYGGRLTSRFGWRIHPISGKRKFHSGIDLEVASGTPVKAAYAGKVITAKYGNSYGYHVIVDHGMIDGKHIVTCYAHNRSLAVSKGQTVATGQVIAFSGSTGDSTGPHVHFEVRVNGKVDNPLTWI
ncbi:M23 family metallopeptidase [Sinanaerobacter sp. ZZT-01]|uniref:M23 family metallopeptidase n=1 Tax=Sinanaerobacter sp. ZZT-01 TaxID=3111540 RepID=UPI002D78886D|nr:M23 family metallopeptidase [Sinanaerobacter sp. ZZT-01]WRR93384.1 M23 family metallopeptidase [Sinanaerobacter sp. ZZT-01]